MTQSSIRTWAWVHKWSSLVCTVFMLLLCLTGLPLIFHHEIGDWLGDHIATPQITHQGPMASMDAMLAAAKAKQPGMVPLYMYREEDEPLQWVISMAKTTTAESGFKQVVLDARTAQVLGEPPVEEGFMYVMFKLHVDLFAGLPGMLFLGLMGFLLLVAIISGVVLYAPFMRKLAFGEIRRQRGQKLKRLDVHNFLGIVILSWALVVAATGVINAWSDLLIKYWQFDQMSQMIAPYKNLPPPTQFASLQASLQVAQKTEPDMQLGFIAFPGTDYASPHHYGIFMRGDSPLTKRLFKPVLVDARTATLTDSRDLPWYLVALLVSQPLHFGDYGGMTLKWLWALLDVITIIVLWTGLMLWWKKRHQYVPDIRSRITLSEAY
ncbi:PepSY domain-containing protein [Methylophilus sp. 5]|uniref:PepSY-associated TM helix domain-containing protein n=1 Tax=Methylophilus sp. 5 TaxID=1112274 RepID=UPI00048D5379|nr:PepSY domain-containing protein [Methylophilus sp. 5]